VTATELRDLLVEIVREAPSFGGASDEVIAGVERVWNALDAAYPPSPAQRTGYEAAVRRSARSNERDPATLP
jgi:hypothetical protein